ncbi:MAG TPA: hypothetical protein VGM32_06585 [Rhodopila sp.]
MTVYMGGPADQGAWSWHVRVAGGMPTFHMTDLVKHPLEIGDARRLGGTQWLLRMEMREQDLQNVADAAQLLAVARDIRKHLLLDGRIGRNAEIDIRPVVKVT